MSFFDTGATFSNYVKSTGIGKIDLPSNLFDSFSSKTNLGNPFLDTTFKAPAKYGAGALDPSSASPGGAQPGAGGTWNFIVAPGEISWGSNAEVNVQKIFGTNTPPAVVGAKGMRDLKLGDALVEGFTRSVQVEDKISALESLMNFTLNSQAGFVNVPVYQVKANSKLYGGADGGFFVIKEVNVKEMMRDLSGMTTRAKVDISFVQVPAYQVDSGLDQASQAVTGSKAAASVQPTDPAERTAKENKPPADQVNPKNKSGPAAPKPNNNIVRNGTTIPGIRTIKGKVFKYNPKTSSYDIPLG